MSGTPSKTQARSNCNQMVLMTVVYFPEKDPTEDVRIPSQQCQIWVVSLPLYQIEEGWGSDCVVVNEAK